MKIMSSPLPPMVVLALLPLFMYVLFVGLSFRPELSWGEVGNAAVFSLMVQPFLFGIAVFVYMAIGAIAVIPVWMMSSGFREPVVTWLWVTAAIATVLFLCAATVVIDSTGPGGRGFGFSGAD